MNIYEIYGREVERHVKTLADYQATLQLLRDLKSGVKDLEDVELLDDGWRWSPPLAVPVPARDRCKQDI